MALDDDDHNCFTETDVNLQSRSWVYQGFFKMEKIALRHRLFEGGWGPMITREVFRRGHAVAAVLYDVEHQLVGLVEQFRVGAYVARQSPWLYEVVAGMVAAGETVTDVIQRELREEANLNADKLIPICEYFTSPGGSDETLSLFCALCDLTQAGGIHGLPEEGENIRVLTMPQQQVFDQLYAGHFNNAATLICLQWLQWHHLKLG